MAELRIALNNIAPEGKTFVMDDPAIWSVPMTECGMDCRVVQPLVGTVTLLPQEDGSGKSLCSPFRYVLCASLIARGCAPTAGKTLTKVLAPACGTKAIPVLRPSGV